MDITTALAHLATALAIGLLFGLEREHDTAADRIRPAGSRTFPLIALAGGVAAALSPVALGVGLAAVAALVVAWYLQGARSEHADIGATTEIAAIAAYLLGALAWVRPELAVPAGVVAAALLAAKRPLHRFATRLVTDRDVTDAMTLFVVAFVVLPLLPDRPLGPYGVLNPARIWVLVIAITLIGWAGYLGTRWFGQRWGLIVAGFAGGFVSGRRRLLCSHGNLPRVVRR
ncbi:MgtC/SapB family protein [Kibdelosporangium philippinense]|uniref:MgtC/SapB family protein n=1 Tax=Kibdelosporangium philippinense TaxID=211113 RepID=UPI0036074B39